MSNLAIVNNLSINDLTLIVNQNPSSSPVVMGQNTILPENDNGNGNLILAQRCNLNNNGLIDKISFYVTIAGGQLRLGIYSDNNGNPDVKLAECNVFTPIVGWNQQSLISPVNLTIGTYWLCYHPQSNILAFKKQSNSGLSRFTSKTFGVLPTNFPTTNLSTSQSTWSFFASNTPSSGQPNSISINGFSLVNANLNIVNNPPASGSGIPPTGSPPTGSPPTGSLPTGTLPLFNQTKLNYLGSFRVPAGTFGPSSFENGGTALAYNPLNNSLFIVGHEPEQAIAEISIPPIKTGSISNLNTATVLQNFVSIINRIPNRNWNSRTDLGGLMVDNGKIFGTVYEYYDGDLNAPYSHFYINGLNLATSPVFGAFKVGNDNPGFVGGYIVNIPSGLSTLLGGNTLSGQEGLSVLGRTSSGPSAYSFDRNNFSANTPANALCNYPLSNQTLGSATTTIACNPANNQFNCFNGTADIGWFSAVFPKNYRSLLTFQNIGFGTVDYKGSNPNGYGVIGGDYGILIIAYDANDLAQAKNGIKQPWEIKPYDAWRFDTSLPYGGGEMGGVAYDEINNRIFVSSKFIDGTLPIIHVFNIT